MGPAKCLAMIALGLMACAGCGGSGSKQSSAANSCSDSGLTAAVAQPLSVLNTAALNVWAGHGDVKALGAAAPGVVSASGFVEAAAKGNQPCGRRLVRARRLLLSSTRELAAAGHTLELLAAAAGKGDDYSGLQSQFLNSWFRGYPDFQHALASLRAAGVPGLVSAKDGKHVFTEAGCAMCHTLAAAGARGTIGPNLDDGKPSTSDVVEYATNGGGTMPSFDGTLSVGQIHAVAGFVSQNAGK